MDITLFPFGIVHLADPTRAAVITHQSWPATMAWIGLSGIAVLATVLAILQGRRLHRGRLDPRVGC